MVRNWRAGDAAGRASYGLVMEGRKVGAVESEQGRLVRLYGELSDEHLKDLAAEPEDLMDEARIALAGEMRRRGFEPEPQRDAEAVVTEDGPERAYGFGAGVPGVVPASGPGVEQALEPGGEERQGMVSLASFYDGLELSRACAALEDVDVEPAIEEIAGDASTGLATRFEVWVDAADVQVSREILHDRLGLFPTLEEETSAVTGEEGAGDEGEVVVAEFESTREAEEVMARLAEAGVAATVERVSESAATAVVMVRAGDQDRALAMLQQHLEVE